MELALMILSGIAVGVFAGFVIETIWNEINK